jgi:Tfp pilus assembly protein PilX
MALLIAVIVLLLMSALGLAALQHSGDEASGSGRARRKDATLYAAESGLAMVKAQVRDALRVTGPDFTVVFDSPSIVEDTFGSPIHVRSGIPSGGTLPATSGAIRINKEGKENAEGHMLNIGASSGSSGFNPLRVDITAMDAGNGLVHLISQYRVYEGSKGY